MDNSNAKECLRYALSYIEKARATGKAAPASTSHVASAEHLYAGLRRDLAEATERAGKELYATLRAREDDRRLMAGKIAPEKANDINRQLTAHITRLRQQAAGIQSLLAAKTSAELGGFANLPLERYPDVVRIASERKAAGAEPADAGWVVAGIQLKPTRKGFLLWLVCLTAAFIGALFYLNVLHIKLPVRMRVSVEDPATGACRVTLENTGLRTVALYVPAPYEGFDGMKDIDRSSTYGLAVYTREKGAREYRLVEAPVECWGRGNEAFRESGCLSVDPGLSLELTFAAAKLRTSQRAIESVRIALVSASGRQPLTRDVALPNR